MYHVTDQPYVESKGENNHGRPTWTELRLCFPNDETFDGDLAGLPVVCMTTTLWKDGDKVTLPTLSPYPRTENNETVHHRVNVPFNLDFYHLFLLHTFGLQRQVLCLPKVQNCRYIHERVLLVLLQNSSKYKELTAENHYESSDNKRLFPVVDGTGPPGTNTKCYRANVYNYPGEEYFVNVHFVTPVSLTVTGTEWDTVKKWAPGGAGAHGVQIGQDGGKLRQCLVNWIMTAASDEDLTDANREAIMPAGFPAGLPLQGSTGERWTKWKEGIEQRLNDDVAMSSVFHDQVQVDGLTAAMGTLAVSGDTRRTL